MNTGQILKSRSSNRYTAVSNQLIQSKELTFGEKGFLFYLLSLPDDWVLYKSNLHSITNEKKGTIDTLFRGLQDKGYIVSTKVIDEKGHFKGWNHIVYDEPILSDIKKNRSRTKPKSKTAEVGQSAPIQRNNIIGLQSIESNTNTDFEFSSNEVPDFVKKDRLKAKAAAKEIEESSLPISELGESLKNDRAVCEILCIQNKISTPELHSAIDAFCNYLKISGEPQSKAGFRKYFNNWLPKNLDKIKPQVRKSQMVY